MMCNESAIQGSAAKIFPGKHVLLNKGDSHGVSDTVESFSIPLDCVESSKGQVQAPQRSLTSASSVSPAFSGFSATPISRTSSDFSASPTSLASSAPPASPPPREWKLVWNDEFNSAEGSAPDPAHWIFDVGGHGFGNHQLEYDTSRPENAIIQQGNLVITAHKETYTGSDGVTCNYTSARLKSDKLFERQYGRFEARIKLPEGQGMWPAFWMLGQDVDQVGWPQCGEIDIMENVGKEPSSVHGTIHGPGYSGSNGIGGTFTLPDGKKFSDDYHVFGMEWDSDSILFSVDGEAYHTVSRASLPESSPWVYDHPFFMLVNLAVGGDWPGPPDDATRFPQKMLVDWIRAYEPVEPEH